jgi:beta-phosphoglucomutase
MSESEKRRYAVLFDMDGVLVDSYEAHYHSWVETCAARGLCLSRERYAGLFGRSFRSFLEDLFPPAENPASRCGKISLAEAEIQQWHDEKELLYRQIIRRNFPEVEGAGDLIFQFHQAGFLLGIASSGPRENVDCLLEHLPNAACIGCTVSANDTLFAKPHPEPYLKCAEGLGILPDRCAVVEDSIHGLQAARSAGMKAIGLTGTSSLEELSLYADRVVTSLTHLPVNEIRSLIDQ